jgi:hypothetical protein
MFFIKPILFTNNMKSDTYKKEEEAILQAVQAYERDKNQKITNLARQYGVSYHRLRRRCLGLASRITRTPPNKILTDDQESALMAWIKRVDDIGAPPTVDLVTNCANSILRRANPDQESPPTVGPNWSYRFIERLPDQYKRIKQKPIDPKRLISEDIGVIQTWFDRLQIVLDTYKITPSNIWNFDETGFRIGQGKDEAVVTAYARSNTRLGSASNRESVTIMECISAAGSVISPLIIVAGKKHMEHWYQTGGLDGEYQVALSDSGFINDYIAYHWIRHFDVLSRDITNKQYRLLLMDNYGSHLTYDFIEYCEKKKIILYCFPPHTTHILQPLDSVPFQQYKHYHAKIVNQQARLGGMLFDKDDFFYSLRDIRKQTFTPRTIRSGFARCGIMPLKPEIILDKLKIEFDFDSESVIDMPNGSGNIMPSSPTTVSISPPRTAPKLRKRIQKFQKSLHETDLSPALTRRLDKIFSGSLMQAELGAQFADDVEHFIKLNRRKSAPKSRRQIKAGGVLSVKDANHRIEARKVEEMKKNWRRADREARKRLQEQTTQSTNPDADIENFEEITRMVAPNNVDNLFTIDTQGWRAEN